MSDNKKIKPDEVMIAEAMAKAEKAFHDYLSEEYGIDSAYFSLRIVVRHVSADFKTFIKEQIFDDRGSYDKETE